LVINRFFKLPANVDVGLSIGISVLKFVLISLGKLYRIDFCDFFVGQPVELAGVDLVELRQLELLPDDVIGGLVGADQFARPNLKKRKQQTLKQQILKR
jgi:hypothetical protein